MPPNDIAQALAGLKSAHLDLLYSQLAKQLTGRQCVIKWGELPENERGRCVRNGDRAIITIDPTQAEDVLLTFLHECAHVLKHWQNLYDLADLRSVPADSGKASPVLAELQRVAMVEREQEAHTQALEWAKAAGAGSVKQRILRLLR